jgi:hypothetical protein
MFIPHPTDLITQIEQLSGEWRDDFEKSDDRGYYISLVNQSIYDLLVRPFVQLPSPIKIPITKLANGISDDPLFLAAIVTVCDSLKDNGWDCSLQYNEQFEIIFVMHVDCSRI